MLNPILSFSATRRMRSFRTMIIVLAYTGAMLLIAVMLLSGLFEPEISMGEIQRSMRCYQVLMAIQFAMLVLIGPTMTSGAIAGERERETLELLLVTNTRSFRIAAGKVMESFALLALLIVCGMPVMCLTMISGGVNFGQILLGVLFLMAVAFGTVCVGIFTSSFCRSTVLSGVLSYLFIAAIGVGTAMPMIFGYPQKITDVVYDNRLYADLTPGEALGMIHPLLLLNPGYGLTALLQGQTSMLAGGGMFSVANNDWGRLLCTYLLMNRAGGETVALVSSGAIVAAGVLLMTLASLMIRPGRKKQY